MRRVGRAAVGAAEGALTMSKHTDGEWTIKGPSVVAGRPDKSGDYAIKANGYIIGEAFHMVGKGVFVDAEANARLMAAAPKMLEALRNIMQMTDADDPDSYRADDREGCLEACFATARDAIAKAEGLR